MSHSLNYWSLLTCLVNEQDKPPTPIGILDSGATSGAITKSNKHALVPTEKKSHKVFILPDGTKAPATKICQLCNKLRSPATEMNVVPGITKSLVSICKIADTDYITVLDKNEANIYDATTTTVPTNLPAILSGDKCQQTGLWGIPLIPNNNSNHHHTINNIFELQTVEKTIRWYHTSAGFPAEETWTQAIQNGAYGTLPGLTTKNAIKYYPESDESQKEHMKGTHQGLHSTKDPAPKEPNQPTLAPYEVYFLVIDPRETMFTDQMGCFPHLSRSGNQYIMVAYHSDSNLILVEAMRNRTEHEMISAYKQIMKRMRKANLTIKKHILDNEALANYKEAVASNKVEYELVPPNNHQRNQTERAIQTFKAHFIAIMCGIDDSFPMNLWYKLLPQAECILNLLCQSNTVPTISVYTHMYGAHD